MGHLFGGAEYLSYQGRTLDERVARNKNTIIRWPTHRWGTQVPWPCTCTAARANVHVRRGQRVAIGSRAKEKTPFCRNSRFMKARLLPGTVTDQRGKICNPWDGFPFTTACHVAGDNRPCSYTQERHTRVGCERIKYRASNRAARRNRIGQGVTIHLEKPAILPLRPSEEMFNVPLFPVQARKTPGGGVGV